MATALIAIGLTSLAGMVPPSARAQTVPKAGPAPTLRIPAATHVNPKFLTLASKLMDAALPRIDDLSNQDALKEYPLSRILPGANTPDDRKLLADGLAKLAALDPITFGRLETSRVVVIMTEAIPFAEMALTHPGGKTGVILLKPSHQRGQNLPSDLKTAYAVIHEFTHIENASEGLPREEDEHLALRNQALLLRADSIFRTPQGVFRNAELQQQANEELFFADEVGAGRAGASDQVATEDVAKRVLAPMRAAAELLRTFGKPFDYVPEHNGFDGVNLIYTLTFDLSGEQRNIRVEADPTSKNGWKASLEQEPGSDINSHWAKIVPMIFVGVLGAALLGMLIPGLGAHLVVPAAKLAAVAAVGKGAAAGLGAGKLAAMAGLFPSIWKPRPDLNRAELDNLAKRFSDTMKTPLIDKIRAQLEQDPGSWNFEVLEKDIGEFQRIWMDWLNSNIPETDTPARQLVNGTLRHWSNNKFTALIGFTNRGFVDQGEALRALDSLRVCAHVMGALPETLVYFLDQPDILDLPAMMKGGPNSEQSRNPDAAPTSGEPAGSPSGLIPFSSGLFLDVDSAAPLDRSAAESHLRSAAEQNHGLVSVSQRDGSGKDVLLEKALDSLTTDLGRSGILVAEFQTYRGVSDDRSSAVGPKIVCVLAWPGENLPATSAPAAGRSSSLGRILPVMSFIALGMLFAGLGQSASLDASPASSHVETTIAGLVQSGGQWLASLGFDFWATGIAISIALYVIFLCARPAWRPKSSFKKPAPTSSLPDYDELKNTAWTTRRFVENPDGTHVEVETRSGARPPAQDYPGDVQTGPTGPFHRPGPKGMTPYKNAPGPDGMVPPSAPARTADLKVNWDERAMDLWKALQEGRDKADRLLSQYQAAGDVVSIEWLDPLTDIGDRRDHREEYVYKINGAFETNKLRTWRDLQTPKRLINFSLEHALQSAGKGGKFSQSCLLIKNRMFRIGQRAVSAYIMENGPGFALEAAILNDIFPNTGNNVG